VAKRSKLYRMGIMSAFAIAIHNFPEGLATFIAACRIFHWVFQLPLPLPSTIYLRELPFRSLFLCNGQ
jgi:hypothetical protein